MKKVCVLMAAYNGGRFIYEQLSSIYSQEDVCIDVFVSLDLSSDNSLELLRQMVKVNPQLNLLDYGKTYGSAGKNFFRLLLEVDFSSYDYISFADQDDIWYPQKIKRAISKLNDSNADAYSGNVLAFWEDGKKKLINKASKQVQYDFLFESAGPGCTFVFTKDFSLQLKDVLLNKNLNNLWLHDWFCYAFSRSRGFNWYIDSKPMMLYRQHDNNSVGANWGVSAIKTRIHEVVKGEAFSKVLSQADYLELNKLRPISLLSKGNATSYFKLSLMALKCRRNGIDKIKFFIIMIFFAFRM